jgi:hypothetical protein
MLADDLRFELAFPIARHLNLDFSKVAFQFLPALSIPRIAAAPAFRLVLFVTQVMCQLGAQRAFNQRLRQLLQKPVLSDQVLRFFVSLK